MWSFLGCPFLQPLFHVGCLLAENSSGISDLCTGEFLEPLNALQIFPSDVDVDLLVILLRQDSLQFLEVLFLKRFGELSCHGLIPVRHPFTGSENAQGGYEDYIAIRQFSLPLH